MRFIFLFVIFIVSCNQQDNTDLDTQLKDDSKHRIVFQDQNGNVLTADDLRGVTGSVNWAIIGGENIPDEAHRLHQNAREIGGKGNYIEALNLLRKVRDLPPRWPYPVYDAAFTYLLQGNFEKSLLHYELVDSLAPNGFFISKTAVHTLKGEKSGKYPRGLYLKYVQLEWLTNSKEKVNKVKSIIEEAPDFAPAWKVLAILEQDEKKMIKAIEKGLSLNPDQQTREDLLINKAIYYSNSNQYPEAIEILGKLIIDSKTTIGNREGAKFVLSNITGVNN